MERSRVAELEERSAALREQVAGQRKAMGGVNAAQESTIAVSTSSFLYGGQVLAWLRVDQQLRRH